MQQIQIEKDLFDEAALQQQLQSQNNPIAVFKAQRKHYLDILTERFNSGRAATELIYLHAALTDKLLSMAWSLYFDDKQQQDLALVAVGGYGRGELHPASDIDLLLLIKKPDKKLNESISQFFTFLWDIGLEVGHSVRTVKECVNEAKNDITVATNIQESRLLIGSEKLFNEQKKKCSPKKIWPSDKFFRAKLEEQIKRHKRYNESAYNLEPNIKESPGGLRDIQMIGWVAKRHFGVDTLEQLVEHGFLTRDEFNELHNGQAFLWRVRYGLHLINNRREDRLLFDHQRKLAKLFGYTDTRNSLAVELFMKQYYRTVMELSRLNEMLLQLFEEEILLAKKTSKPVPINNRFQSIKGYLEVTFDSVFKAYPFALLEVFLLLAQNPELKGVRANTIRLIRSHRHLINSKFRDDIRCRSLFIEFFKQSHGITHELRRMNRYGVLAAYIPAFEKIVGQMQHDLFHVYTVDEHTIMLIRNLRRFTVPEFYNEFPLASELISNIPKQELILIAGLFHDIAKGRGGEHAKLGAIDATEFCQRHDLSDYDTKMVAWIVENHLLMSTTAQKKDISDPDVVYEFATQVGDIIHLKYLYLLTVADIRATSDSLWNSWKDSLLRNLYHATRDVLRRGLENPALKTELAKENKRLAVELLPAQHDINLVEALWQQFNNDYFTRHTASEIAWQTNAILNSNKTPVIDFKHSEKHNVSSLFIYTPTFTGLFSIITSVLEYFKIDVIDARIIESNHGHALDTYHIQNQTGTTITDELCQKITDSLTEQIDLKQRKARSTETDFIGRREKQFKFPTQVLFDDDSNAHTTVMEVKSSDQTGILSQLALILDKHKINIISAKIATYGERIEDIFNLTNALGEKLSQQEQQELQDAICQQLDKTLQL